VILELLVLAIIIGLICKGDLARLADIKLYRWWLILVVVGLWVVPYGLKYAVDTHRYAAVYAILHIAQFAALMALAVINYRMPGLRLAALGVLSNTVAVTANGGFMPASYEACKRAFGNPDTTIPMVHHAFIDSSTRVPFLCDIVPLPRPYLWTNGVYSIGDVVTTLGAMIAIIAIMRKPAPKPAVQPEEQ